MGVNFKSIYVQLYGYEVNIFDIWEPVLMTKDLPMDLWD